MFRSRFFVLLIVVFGFGWVTVIGQQTEDDCPAYVQQVLTELDRVCSSVQRNQVCNANTRVNATPAAENTRFSFDVGDSVGIEAIDGLRLSPLNQRRGEWGIVLMRVQANLPDAYPGQNVTLVAFGATKVTPLFSGADRHLGHEFRLETRIGRLECSAAQLDGLLIQSPAGTRRVELTINGVDFLFGSTLFLTAVPGQAMTIRTLEGAAYVRTAQGESLAPAGAQLSIPMDESMNPVGAPEMPIAYQVDELVSLPLSLLDTVIQPAVPIVEAQLNAVIEAIHLGDAESLIDTLDVDAALWFDGTLIGDPPLEVLTGDLDPVQGAVEAIQTALPTLIPPLPTLIPPLATLIPPLPTLVPALPTLPPPTEVLATVLAPVQTLIAPLPTLIPPLPTLPPLFP